MKSFWILALKNKQKDFSKNLKKTVKIEINSSNLVKFIKHPYNYAKISLNLYSSKFSKKLYLQPALFTIIALKTYLNLIYRQNS